MSFTTNGTTLDSVKSGETWVAGYSAPLILSSESFEDNIQIGRFAKLDTGRIDNMDGSATPVIAGVVLRGVANDVESSETIGTDLHSHIEYQRGGMVTVKVKAGETPAQFGRVFVSNAGDANDGMAVTAAGAGVVSANAEFIKEISTDVWLVNLMLASA